MLGVLIGIASLVGMTSMVRGFDESLRDTIRTIGPDTIFVTQFSGLSVSSGDDFFELMQRPSLTPADARAIARSAPTIAGVTLVLGEGGPPTQAQLQYRNRRSKTINVLGSTENFSAVYHIEVATGRFFTAAEVSHRRQVVVLGQTPYQALFPHADPVGQAGASRQQALSGRRRPRSPRPSPGGLGGGQDDFVVIPHSAYQKQFGLRATRARRGRVAEHHDRGGAARRRRPGRRAARRRERHAHPGTACGWTSRTTSIC